MMSLVKEDQKFYCLHTKKVAVVKNNCAETKLSHNGNADIFSHLYAVSHNFTLPCILVPPGLFRAFRYSDSAASQ